MLSTQLSLHEITNAATRPFDNSNYHFELQQEHGTGYLACSPGNPVATLNLPFNLAIRQILLDIPSVHFDFYVTRQAWSKAFRSRETADNDPIVKALVNVSANPSMLMDVGKILSAQKFYFQRPTCHIPGQVYQNPHHVSFPGIEPRILDDKQKAKSQSDADCIEDAEAPEGTDKDDLKNEFAVVFGSLIRSHCLSQFAADRRIKTSLTP